MNELDVKLQNIREKLLALLKQYQFLQKENEQLQKEVSKQKEIILQRDEQLSYIHHQMDVLKIGVQNWSNEDKKVLEKRIDAYLKEIEKCLSLLNA